LRLCWRAPLMMISFMFVCSDNQLRYLKEFSSGH